VATPPILLSINDGIASVTLNRPDKRNALNRETLTAFIDALDRVAAGGDVRVTVLRGAGTSFCAGMDLGEMLAMREEHGWFDYELLPELLHRVAALRHPTVAVVQGTAIAGGCELALHCDVRLGTADAQFAMPLARLGMVAPAYAIKRLIETVGVSAARDLLLTGDVVNGERALELGLLTRLESKDRLAETTSRLVNKIASCAPLSVREMKRAIGELSAELPHAIETALNARRLEISRSEDLREGLRAFVERRRPRFKGV
jgi:enoyl-CoA hydratase/carnithine racemase